MHTHPMFDALHTNTLEITGRLRLYDDFGKFKVTGTYTGPDLGGPSEVRHIGCEGQCGCDFGSSEKIRVWLDVPVRIVEREGGSLYIEKAGPPKVRLDDEPLSEEQTETLIGLVKADLAEAETRELRGLVLGKLQDNAAQSLGDSPRFRRLFAAASLEDLAECWAWSWCRSVLGDKFLQKALKEASTLRGLHEALQKAAKAAEAPKARAEAARRAEADKAERARRAARAARVERFEARIAAAFRD